MSDIGHAQDGATERLDRFGAELGTARSHLDAFVRSAQQSRSQLDWFAKSARDSARASAQAITEATARLARIAALSAEKGPAAPSSHGGGDSGKPLGAELAGNLTAAIQASVAPLMAVGVRIESMFRSTVLRIEAVFIKLGQHLAKIFSFKFLAAALKELAQHSDATWKSVVIGAARATVAVNRFAYELSHVGTLGDRIVRGLKLGVIKAAFGTLERNAQTPWIRMSATAGREATRVVQYLNRMGALSQHALKPLSGAGGSLFGRGFSGAANSATNQMRGFAAEALAALGVFGLGYKAVQFFKDAAKAASDLNEQADKTRSILGDSATIVEAAAQQMADAFGVPKVQFAGAASSFASIAKASGKGAEEAARFGVELTKLALDASSLSNVPIDETFAAFRSGLIGESEPMRRFNVFLGEENVKAQAAASGVARMGEKLTQNQKIMARAAIMTASLSDAQDNLKDTFAGVANQSRAVGGRLTNLQAEVGKAIEGITKGLYGALNAALAETTRLWIENKDAIAEWAGQGATSTEIVAEGVGKVGMGVGLVSDAFQVAAGVFNRFVGFMSGAFGGLARLLDALDKGLGKIVRGLGGTYEGTSIFEEYAAAAEKFAGEQKKLADVQLFGDLPSAKIATFFDKVKEGARAASGAMTDAKGKVAAVGDAFSEVGAKVDKFITDLRDKIANFGLSDLQSQLVKLAEEGASDEDIAKAEGLAKQLTLMERFKKLTEETRSPLERFRQEMTRLDELQAKGFDLSVIEKGRAAAMKDFQGTMQAEGPKFAAAMEFGSAEARSTVLNFRTGNAAGADPIKAVAAEAKQQTSLAKRSVELLDRIVRQGVGAAPAMAIVPI